MKSRLTIILALSISVSIISPALAPDNAGGIIAHPYSPDQPMDPQGYQPNITIDSITMCFRDDPLAHGSDHPQDTHQHQPLMNVSASSRPDSILQPIDTSPPLPIFLRRTHPISPAHVLARDISKPLPTNKFYGNWLLGDAHAPIWTHPYGLRWDSVANSNWFGHESPQQGLSISHIDDSSKAYGPWDEHQATRYYLNPFLVSMGMSAVEFTGTHGMTVGGFGEFGCTLVMFPAQERDAGREEAPWESITVPVVRGMAFVTGVYRNLTPRVFSNILVRTLTLDSAFMASGGGGGGGGRWVKYRFLLENGVTWLVYAKADPGGAPLTFELQGQGQAVATSGKFSGLLQIAKVPVGNVAAETTYDQAKGVYATNGDLIIRQKYVNRLKHFPKLLLSARMFIDGRATKLETDQTIFLSCQ